MTFDPPLLPARLVRRYKRFLVDLVLKGTGEAITAHCPNPGAMLGVAPEGARAFVSYSADPKRKLAYTLRLVEADGTWVGIDTGAPNKLAREAIEAGAIPELSGYAAITPEARYGAENSRIDLLLTHPDRPPCYVEVKNVHLRRTGARAEFPDCVTARGAKHLRELSRVVEAGGRAVALFVIQRGDCDSFAPAADLDPAWAAAFAAAQAAGVEALAYGCDVSPDGIALRRALTISPPV